LPIDLSIIIPANNEAARLPVTLPRVLSFMDSHPRTSELIVVDSGSSDETASIARQFAANRQDLHVEIVKEPGKGLAVRRGMSRATGAYRFICDADLSMPIKELERFFPPQANDVEIAIASREAPGAVRYDEPSYRHLIGRAFNALVRLLAIPDVADTQCGFKLFRGDIAEDLFRVQTLNGWTFDVELLFVAQRRGYGIMEIPIPWYYFPGSRVRIIRDSIAMFSDLFRIRYNALRGYYDPPRVPPPASSL
jgi:glycosyltransferase involved in cell wall biosynthesis